MVWWTCCEEYEMKQDEAGWTEKAAGLLGCRCMSSVALGALGRLASRDRLHGEGFRRVGGWAWRVCQEAMRGCRIATCFLRTRTVVLLSCVRGAC